MSDKCKCIICLLDIFQTKRPVTTKIFNYLEDLQVVIAANKELQYEVYAEYFEKFDLPHPTKTKILRTFGHVGCRMAVIFLYHNQWVHSGVFERKEGKEIEEDIEEREDGEDMDVEGEGMGDDKWLDSDTDYAVEFSYTVDSHLMQEVIQLYSYKIALLFFWLPICSFFIHSELMFHSAVNTTLLF